MGIPEFNKRGTLDKGIYNCRTDEFFERFCYGSGTVRSDYKKVLEQLFAFAISRNVKSIIVGGSFITNKLEPKDLDCILIVPNEKCCTLQTNELLIMNGCELDVLIIDENRKDTIYSFLNMFSKDRYDIDVGMVEIILDEVKDKSTWDDYDLYYSVESLLIAREAYINRHVIKCVEEKKVLVTICNAKEYMFWNYDIAPIVSSSGWIFAPYIYCCDKDIEDEIQKLEIWLRYIYNTYEKELCIYADGVGTYLLGRCIKDKNNYVYFDKIIMTKALLSCCFNWEEEINKGKVNYVINLIDTLAKKVVTEIIPKTLKKDDIFGNAYKNGFDDSKVLNLHYKNGLRVSDDEFKNTILPMYHMSIIVQDNIERVCWENITEIVNRDIDLHDVNLQALSLINNSENNVSNE